MVLKHTIENYLQINFIKFFVIFFNWFTIANITIIYISHFINDKHQYLIKEI